MLLQWDPRGATGAHLFRYLTGFGRNYERGSGKYMYQVVKRDGKIVEFNLSKISTAITKAFEATHKEYNPDIIDLLALKVTADYQDKIHDGRITAIT